MTAPVFLKYCKNQPSDIKTLRLLKNYNRVEETKSHKLIGHDQKTLAKSLIEIPTN